MALEDLRTMKCVPCEGGVPKLTPAETGDFLKQVDGWSVKDDRLVKGMAFKDFLTVMQFLNDVARIAEEEGHHPDFRVHGWNKVGFEIYTHAIGGLSRNDFILAAKIDAAAKRHHAA